VDAAYVSDGHVYLVGGGRFVRYTVAGDGTLPSSSTRITRGRSRCRLASGWTACSSAARTPTCSRVPGTPSSAPARNSTHRWRSPRSATTGATSGRRAGGIGGLFDSAGALYLFQGGSYVRYPAADGDGDGAARAV